MATTELPVPPCSVLSRALCDTIAAMLAPPSTYRLDTGGSAPRSSMRLSDFPPPLSWVVVITLLWVMLFLVRHAARPLPLPLLAWPCDSTLTGGSRAVLPRIKSPGTFGSSRTPLAGLRRRRWTPRALGSGPMLTRTKQAKNNAKGKDEHTLFIGPSVSLAEGGD